MKNKIIFLDIDGVLNGYGPFTDVAFYVLKFLHLQKLWYKWDLFGVRTFKVFLLWIIMKRTSAKVVLSSSWRSGWKVPYNECGDRMKSLKKKFKWFKIDVLDVTPKYFGGRREDEIISWLSQHEDSVGRFIILDDESFDLTVFINHELVITSNPRIEMITGNKHDRTGLKLHHVLKCIKLLNSNRVNLGK